MDRREGLIAMDRGGGPIGFVLGLVLSVTAAGLLIALGGFLSFVSLVGQQSRLPPLSEETDAIVVLTGGRARIAEGMALLKEGHGERLLISGVNVHIERKEIRKLIDPDAYTRFDCCVDLDKSATNTIGNAVETAGWAMRNNFQRVIVVTASYHMPRSLAEMNRAAPEITWIPHAVHPRTVHLRDWWRWPGSARLLFSEYVKYLAMQFRFRLEAL